MMGCRLWEFGWRKALGLLLKVPVRIARTLLRCCLGSKLPPFLTAEPSFLSHGSAHSNMELKNEASGAVVFIWLKLEHVPGCLWEISQPLEEFQSALSTLLQEEQTSTYILLIREVSC